MGIPEQRAELNTMIANANLVITKASAALAKLNRAESGVAPLQDGDTLALEPVQVDRYQAEATAALVEIKAIKLEVEPLPDPIGGIEVVPAEL